MAEFEGEKPTLCAEHTEVSRHAGAGASGWCGAASNADCNSIKVCSLTRQTPCCARCPSAVAEIDQMFPLHLLLHVRSSQQQQLTLAQYVRMIDRRSHLQSLSSHFERG